MKNYTIQGQIVVNTTSQLIANLVIEVLYRQKGKTIKMDKVSPDTKGRFKSQFSDTLLSNATKRNPVNVIFRAYQDNKNIQSKGEIFELQPKNQNINIKLIGKTSTSNNVPSQKNIYTVHGIIAGAKGNGVSKARIIVWRQSIRKHQKLTQGFTDNYGQYKIEYVPPSVRGKLLIRIEAIAKELKTSLQSSVIEALPDLKIDLNERPLDPSEYTELLNAINLGLDGLKVLDLIENQKNHDISFLARKINRSIESIMRFVLSSKLEAKFKIPAEAFYAFLRQHVPTSLPGSLLKATKNFTIIDLLLNQIGSLVFGLSPYVQTNTLKGAVEKKIIGMSYQNQIPQIVKQLQSLRAEDTLRNTYIQGTSTLADLLNLAKMPKAKQSLFAQTLNANNKSMAAFWKEIGDGKHGLTPKEISSAQHIIELAALVNNHLPLVRLLQQRFIKKTFKSLSDLARLSKQDWNNLVKKSGVPEDIDNKGSKDSKQEFANNLYKQVTSKYPTVALSVRLPKAEYIQKELRKPVTRFFANNSSLELTNMNIPIYLEKEGKKAFTGIDKKYQDEVVKIVRKLQRILRITSDVDSADMLLNLGIHSATQIWEMGQYQFTKKAIAAGISESTAKLIHGTSSFRYGYVVSLFTQLNQGFTGILPAAVGTPVDRELLSSTVLRDQSLATLFGSQDYCTCDDCTSLLSPAAYLCDILSWLGNLYANPDDPESTQKVLDVLLTRRPDIGHLLLNCPNTDIALPYIDLVNELLEDKIHTPSTPTKRWKQTSEKTTAADLRAEPAHLNKEAYDELLNSRYPHTLPYDRALDELRTYLAQSGIALWLLRDSLLPVHTVPTLEANLRIAAEWFGICSTEIHLIIDEHTTVDSLREIWNTSDSVHVLAQLVPRPNISEDIGKLFFLQAAGISYEQLLELMEVKWVVHDPPELSIVGIDDTCDLSKLTLSPLNPAILDRIHRFLRLWRHDTWTMWELDLLLQSGTIGNGTLDTNTLISLYEFRRLQQLTGLPVDAQLAFYQDLDTNSHLAPDGSITLSLYARLFLNSAVLPSSDPQHTDFSVLPSSSVSPGHLENYIDAIRAALRLEADDVEPLFNLTNLDLSHDDLTVENLSKLYRVVELARAARMSVASFKSLLPLMGTYTGTPEEVLAEALLEALADPRQTRLFIEKMRILEQQDSGFSGDEIVYVLSYNPDVSAAIRDTEIVSVLSAIRTAIQLANSEIDSEDHVTSLNKALLQLGLEQTDVNEIISIVKGDYSGASPDAVVSRVLSSILNVDDLNSLQEGGDYALLPLPDAPTPEEKNFRAKNILDLNSFKTELTKKLVIHAIHLVMSLKEDVVELLIEDLDVNYKNIQSVLTDSVLGPKPDGSYLPLTDQLSFSDQYLAVRLLHKISIVVRQLHLEKEDLEWLLNNASIYNGLNLTSLPIKAGEQSQKVDNLLATVLFMKLERDFNMAPVDSNTPDLFTLISKIAIGDITSETEAQNALATITGWNQTDIETLAKPTNLNLSFTNDYLLPSTYDHLRQLMLMLQVSGAGSSDQLRKWSGIDITDVENSAKEVRSALKSRYSTSEWQTFAPKFIDPMRERRSAALQAYLLGLREPRYIGKLVYGDSNDLFDYFLIDVEMSSCEVTTRVVQAYAAVQLFVESCLLGNEPNVVADPENDKWKEWSWRNRYRVWEAARRVFLYPENWLIESQRPNRTEIFQKLEQDVHQNESTHDYLEKVMLDYVDQLDGLAHLQVTGSCTIRRSDSSTTHVIARTPDDPPRYYHRTLTNGSWSGWVKVPFDIKARIAVPAVYSGRLYLFWMDIKIANEPKQDLPAAHPSEAPPPQNVAKYVMIGLNFSIFRNGSWAPPQKSRGKLFDIPYQLLSEDQNNHSQSVESLFTLKISQPDSTDHNYGDLLRIDVFRQGSYETLEFVSMDPVYILAQRSIFLTILTDSYDPTKAIHIGQATFDGRFNTLSLNKHLLVAVNFESVPLLEHAKEAKYGPHVTELLELDSPSRPLTSGLLDDVFPMAGELVRLPDSSSTTLWRVLGNASSFSIVIDDSEYNFNLIPPFFFQDKYRSYFVNFASTDLGLGYGFNRFYHRYARLFWHQLSSGGFPALYKPKLQSRPDSIDLANSFSFTETYWPDHDNVVSRDEPSMSETDEIEAYRGVQFTRDAAYLTYNWELFFHAPLYVAERLSQNQKFEDAEKWFRYIYDPTNNTSEFDPMSRWILRPLRELTQDTIFQQRINNLLLSVHYGNREAEDQVYRWERDPFNPFLLADLRPVAYMKRVVMSYIDNLIAWADNLFASDSREALNEATLLYVTAAKILGPEPVAVTPPQHVDRSFDDLKPFLDAFSNAMVEVENSVVTEVGRDEGLIPLPPIPLPSPPTFYFKIPPNEKLLGYWKTVADRMFKLRHCQNIKGVKRKLPLFDARIDPGLLVRARAAGVDIGSVLNDIKVPMPGYRFTALYPVALDFCQTVCDYGSKLLAVTEKRDAAELELMLATNHQQLHDNMEQIHQKSIDEINKQIDALYQTLNINQTKLEYAKSAGGIKGEEVVAISLLTSAAATKLTASIVKSSAGGEHVLPDGQVGSEGAGGTPVATMKEGGSHAGHSTDSGAEAAELLAESLETAAEITKIKGEISERAEKYEYKARESEIEIERVNADITAAKIRLEIASLELENYRTESNMLQQEIDYLTNKFTNQELYDWILNRLSDTYFQSYRLAYRMCKSVGRCYRYELGLAEDSPGNTFIRFGYWDSLKKGLLAGESLSHDLRKMQASYLERNSRRFEITRHVSLAKISSEALSQLKNDLVCTFDLPEHLFHQDYPDHYQRRLKQVSVTIVYPNPGLFDNIRGTLTMTRNKIYMSDGSSIEQYAAVPQKIVLSNGQNDSGMFFNELRDNLRDPRYLPFEGAGAISSWYLEIPQDSNDDIDLSEIEDVVLHVHYTALSK